MTNFILGDLRFKAPEPHFDDEGLIDVSKESNVICPQENYDRSKYFMTEDCLRLNIYAPKDHPGSLPVMVFIHGGAFTLGSGVFQDCNPSFFMDFPVILVTINYRSS